MSGEMDPHHKDAKTQGTQDRAVTERGGIMLHLSPTAATVIAKQARPSTNTRTNKRISPAAAHGFVYSFHHSVMVISKTTTRNRPGDLRSQIFVPFVTLCLGGEAEKERSWASFQAKSRW
jgi:hypothetical protein